MSTKYSSLIRTYCHNHPLHVINRFLGSCRPSSLFPPPPFLIKLTLQPQDNLINSPKANHRFSRPNGGDVLNLGLKPILSFPNPKKAPLSIFFKAATNNFVVHYNQAPSWLTSYGNRLPLSSEGKCIIHKQTCGRLKLMQIKRRCTLVLKIVNNYSVSSPSYNYRPPVIFFLVLYKVTLVLYKIYSTLQIKKHNNQQLCIFSTSDECSQ